MPVLVQRNRRRKEDNNDAQPSQQNEQKEENITEPLLKNGEELAEKMEKIKETGSVKSIKDLSVASESAIRRQKLAIQLEYERRKKEHEIELLDLEMQLKLAEIDEQYEQDDIDNHSINTEKISIDGWLNEQEKTREAETASHEKNISTDIHKFLSRQSMPKDLPIFYGNPTDWPNFISQYKNSTIMCGFTDEENQCRLQKCLKGKAREIVDSLLIIPSNVNKVIEVLEKRFGNSERIIFMLLDKVKKMPIIKDDRLENLINFSDSVTNLIYTLQTLNRTDHLQNPILLHELLEKLPVSHKIRWIQKSKSLKPTDLKLEKFKEWLSDQADTAAEIVIPNLTNFEEKHKSKFKNVFFTKDENSKCFCCNLQKHPLEKCKKFLSYSVNERWTFVTEKRVCFSCLNPGHGSINCKRKQICNINDCKRTHNRLLHHEHEYKFSKMEDKNKNVSCQTNCHMSEETSDILLKILPVKLYGKTKSIDTFALLDDASTVTLIDQKVAKEIGLDGPEKSLNIQWTNENFQQKLDSKVVTFSISGRESKRFLIRHARTMKDLSLPTQIIDTEELLQKYPYLNHPNVTKSKFIGKPTVLIGQDNWPLLINRKTVHGPWKGPALSKTLLGWVIHGITGKFKNDKSYLYHIYKEKDDLDILHDMIKEQWKLENIGIKQITNSMESVQDKRAQIILDNTMRRIGNKFETGLLWKEDEVVFPESKNMALRRLQSIEKKMDRDKIYAESYCKKMKEMVEKGYLKQLTPKEADLETPKTWYLPHFGIINPNKPNKFRIVFDAAAKSNGICLNDKLLTGPDLYNSLYSILLNFRIKKIAFVADIKEMFLQVLVRQEDKCAQRILWRGMERDKEPDIYEIQVVFFGSTCGPCLAQEAKNKNTLEFQDQFPEAANAIIKQHYMDDYLGGADNEDEAIKLINEVIEIHKRGGFIICNWISNSLKVLKHIDPSITKFGQQNVDINTINPQNEITTERILGLWWNSVEDSFKFNLKFHKIDKNLLNGEKRPTKREVLKIIMSIFDPLGFIANFVIQAKILLQEIWQSGIGWDDEITNSLNDKWQKWLKDLKNIDKFKLPRQYCTINLSNSTNELHIFCDASEKAYATVAYLRFKEDKTISTAFVCAKTRVCPLRSVSIPRLELQAALMGAKVGNFLKKELNIPINKVTYWTDSNTVLHWIKSEAKRFKMFVAQRVSEIQELTDSNNWNYISSNNNVADEATKRHKFSFDFSMNSRWLNGPKFLVDTDIKFPEDKPGEIELEKLEMRNNHITMVTTTKENLCVPEPTHFSSWNKILRSTGWMLRFIQKCRKEIPKNDYSELKVDELKEAENLLIRRIQDDCFINEIIQLKKKNNLLKSSRLYNLTCLLDEKGIICISGRLNSCQFINENMKKPAILDPRHDLTKLLVKQYHENANHVGKEMVINELRQKYWILNIRQAVKNAFRNCQFCKIKKVKLSTQIMGQMPECRLEPTIRPFIKSGVDYFGPIEIRNKRRHEKRYGVIFTCLVTRAVHLEIANDLSTNGFIHVYRQFGCRRGFPDEIYSDNGTNFKGAERILKEALNNFNQNEIIEKLSQRNTKWYFNPPLAPHMGGAWERLIKIIKNILHQVLKEKYPEEYVLRTLFAEIENIVNSRPLTYVSTDPDDPETLTPNHFLIGPSYSALSCTVTDDTNLCLLSKWQAAQRLTDLFWQRWSREYLPTLLTRSKWKNQQRQVKINDIVLIADPEGQRNLWPIGRIVALYPGKDGNVRVVDIKTSKNGILRRPVTKICVLPVQTQK